MEAKWLKDSLFGGMTANGFKLGTVLTLGWFWPRTCGCTILYRGESMETVDSNSILAVANVDTCLISPFGYVPHNIDSTHFYVVRRANNCGYEECTLAAAVRVSIDSDGELAPLRPNDIFSTKAKQKGGSKVQFVWYYCPIEQDSEPTYFKVYCDGGTGQIDYENQIAVIHYAGRRFYSYQSSTLECSRYLFTIRAEDTAGTINRSLAQIRIQLDSTIPDSINILSAEAI